MCRIYNWSRGRIPVITTCSCGSFSNNFEPQAMTPSAMSFGSSCWMLLVPHSKTATRRETGRERWSTFQRRFCVESPRMPQLTVLNDFRRSHTSGYRANPSTIESPRTMTLDFSLIILLTWFRWKPYQPGLLRRNAGLVQWDTDNTQTQKRITYLQLTYLQLEKMNK